MDWQAAIEKQRNALKQVLTALVAMAGLAGAAPGFPSRGGVGGGGTLPRHRYLAVLRLLRPAESAARRLVIAFARDIVVAPPPRHPRRRRQKARPAFLRNGVGTGIVMPTGVSGPAALVRPPALPLFDPPRRPAHQRPARRTAAVGVPRISVPGQRAPYPVVPRRVPSPHDPIDTTRLGSRLHALDATLHDLPGQAQRFARWRASRDAAGTRERNLDAAQSKNRHAAGTEPGKKQNSRIWPLRLGRPPGARRRPVHEVQQILATAHWLAFQALEHPDTS